MLYTLVGIIKLKTLDKFFPKPFLDTAGMACSFNTGEMFFWWIKVGLFKPVAIKAAEIEWLKNKNAAWEKSGKKIQATKKTMPGKVQSITSWKHNPGNEIRIGRKEIK